MLLVLSRECFDADEGVTSFYGEIQRANVDQFLTRDVAQIFSPRARSTDGQEVLARCQEL